MACAVVTVSGNVIHWTTPNQKDISHYEVYRRTAAATAAITTSDMVAKIPHITNTVGAFPFYTDEFTAVNTTTAYWYWVKSVAYDGQRSTGAHPTITADRSSLPTLLTAAEYHSATSITLTVGTSTGTISDLTTMLDSANYTIGEVAGVPGLDLTIDFTSNVTSINQIVVAAYYDGSGTHAVRVQLYNYSSSAWVTIHTLNDGRDYEQHYKKIIDDTPFMTSGIASIRLYHTENGNDAHTLYVDYIGLTA